jgi:hypothetical protein
MSVGFIYKAGHVAFCLKKKQLPLPRSPATTSTDQIFTHGQIGPSHTVDQTVAMRGCAMKPTNADDLSNRVR